MLSCLCVDQYFVSALDVSNIIISLCLKSVFILLRSVNLDELAEQMELDEEEVIKRQREARQARIAQLVGPEKNPESSSVNANRSFSESDGTSSDDESDQSSSSSDSQSSSSESGWSEDSERRSKGSHTNNKFKDKLGSEKQAKRHIRDEKNENNSNRIELDELKRSKGKNYKEKSSKKENEKYSKGDAKRASASEKNSTKMSLNKHPDAMSRKRRGNESNDAGMAAKKQAGEDEREKERKKILEHRANIAGQKKLTIEKEVKTDSDDEASRSLDMFAGDEAFAGNDMFSDNFDVSFLLTNLVELILKLFNSLSVLSFAANAYTKLM